ncbi:class I SAM-dependent methyltransferase [Roseicyclus marinus]|uniref:class I SAM-dependent methyltransferase n=1 Tax=Roseicyclus marinus TaxID=2161673 RepID=UPI00240FC44C|nr:class I SAM-dependent methyltransferase [Roseicyclus marinus]MDG3041598.1 class I SAM-dependent methyltransferase [Roseicyclus marinus]
MSLGNVQDGNVSFVFCFDPMIHFDSDVVRSYLAEFHRVMKPGAFAFLHYSNLTGIPGGDFQRNAHAWIFMLVQLFSHYAQKEGLQVVKQKTIDWGSGEKRVKDLDGLTLLRWASEPR